MGRSGRKRNGASSHLRKGRDLNGKERQIGERDSEGKEIGFICAKGDCWQSVWEHDLVQTETLYDEAMTQWEHHLGKRPNPEEIARRVCVNQKNAREVALLAQRNREMLARFRGFTDEGGERWPSVWEHDRRCTTDAFLDAMEEWEEGGRQGKKPQPRTFAEENCLNIEYIDRATQEAQREWEYIAWRKSRDPLEEESGEAAVYPGIIPGSQIEVIREGTLQGRVGSEEDEFEQIVKDIKPQKTEVWQGSYSYHVDALGHTVSLSALRPSSPAAYGAGKRIEEVVMHGELYEGDVEARVVLEAESPEEQQEAALRRLAEGDESKELRILEVLGLDPEIIIRRDKAIASGEHWERPLALVEATVFFPGVGQVAALASGRSNDEALHHLQKVLPRASLS